MEKRILESCVLSRSIWERVVGLVQSDDLSDMGHTLLKEIGKYYGIDKEAQQVDKSILYDRLSKNYPKRKGELKSVLDSFGDTSAANVLQELVSLRKQSVGREIAGLLVTNPDSPKILSMMEDFSSIEILESEDIRPVGETVKEALVHMADPKNRIKLYPRALDERLSEGAQLGNHVVIFARPNLGKTAFMVNLARGLLRDGRRVLYLINEEPVNQVLKRIVGRITSLTGQEINHDVDSAIEQTGELLDLLYMRDINGGTFSDIRCLTKEVKPSVLIIDQLRNVKVADENRVTALEGAAQAARDIAKECGVLVCSVTQAGDSARNKLVLDDGDIDFSNTGIPGAADLIVGIGADRDYRERGRRMITIVKNKRGTDHSSFPVSIDEQVAKILSL